MISPVTPGDATTLIAKVKSHLVHPVSLTTGISVPNSQPKVLFNPPASHAVVFVASDPGAPSAQQCCLRPPGQQSPRSLSCENIAPAPPAWGGISPRRSWASLFRACPFPKGGLASRLARLAEGTGCPLHALPRCPGGRLSTAGEKRHVHGETWGAECVL